MKNFIRSLFCHTTIDGEFNSRNYILTKICSKLYNKINRTDFRKKGVLHKVQKETSQIN